MVFSSTTYRTFSAVDADTAVLIKSAERDSIRKERKFVDDSTNSL